MTDPSESEGAFRNRCANTARTLAPLVGYFISRISFEAFNEDDSLEITLREGPSKPDVVISLSGLYYATVSKPPEISGCFVDEISLAHLPRTPHPWPEGAAGRVGRFDGLSELAWLQIIGPAEVDVIAAIVTVYTAMSDDEASADERV
ncbi:hypothetical protein [Streptomyces sp. NPDC001435]|uniref:hypothetical protein n=1 Tax=Streptomyces sp. NPDC001435 TaxID=3364576 RepID=UPI0036A5298C